MHLHVCILVCSYAPCLHLYVRVVEARFWFLSLKHRGHVRIQKILPEGTYFDGFFCCCFLLDEVGVKYHYKRVIIGPPAKRHLNCVSPAGR